MNEPPGITFFSRTYKTWLRIITEGEYAGWICYRDWEGQCWVSWFKAKQEHLKEIAGACTYDPHT